jgi:diaminohydroxyphosphoribosylaminopyrimidine deaminase/5-amino-6-(5-phosphoribosylamino)uracil reductase
MMEMSGEPINGEHSGVPSPFMQRALDLAAYARGHCHPNPMVGCVIVKEGVKEGQIVGEGWHRRVGTPHAEVYALQQAGEAARGATVYVTLEPCNHWGCTPPCTNALINAGVAQVVIAMRDPNPLAQGGINALRQAGIAVVVGDGAEESRRLNERWLAYLRQQRPFVHAKLAMSLDARVATSSGESQWITGADARNLGHQWRDSHEALLVGANTLRTDNPSLTCRLPSTDLQGPLPVRQPLRVVLAGAQPLPADSKLFQDEAAPTLVIAADPYYRQHKAALAMQGKHVEIIGVLARRGYPDPAGILQCLYQRKVVGLLLEGGPTVVAAFLDAGLVDRISTFVAPMLLGPSGIPAFRHADTAHLDQALTLDITERIAVGKDTLLSGRVRQRVQRIQDEVRENEVMENVYRHC